MMTENKSTIVKVDLQYVRNLGNYESIRVNLGVEDSVREGENANAAMDRVYAFVEKKLIEKMEEIESELKGGK
jgi:5-methylthioribose kinase